MVVFQMDLKKSSSHHVKQLVNLLFEKCFRIKKWLIVDFMENENSKATTKVNFFNSLKWTFPRSSFLDGCLRFEVLVATARCETILRLDYVKL